MKTLVLDTNVLLRFLLNDIPSQTEEVKKQIKLAKQEQLKLVIHILVIFEVIYALTKYYGFPKDQVVLTLKKIVTFKYLNVLDREVIQDSLDLYQARNLSFVDCFLLKYTHQINGELFTFDKQLLKNT